MPETTILIVEDEAIVAMDLANKLHRLGYAVCGSSASGEEALELVRAYCPELVLMDIHLAGEMDGVAAAEHIRRECDIPVIYLTAHADHVTLDRAKRTEPFGYILKPFDDQDLTSHIEMALYKHQAERKLRESEERWRVTLGSIGDAVIACDTAACVTFLNPVAAALTGWAQAEALGKPITSVVQFINEVSHEPVEDLVTLVLHENRVVELANHTALITRDGREVPVEDSAAPITDAAGRVIGVVIVFHDVTEKRRAAEALARLASFPRLNPNPIVEVDVTGHINYCNPAAEQLFPELAACGTEHPWLADWESVAGAVCREEQRGAFREVAIGEACYEQVIHYMQEVQCIRIYGRDITKRKRAEEERERLLATVQRQAAELEATISSIAGGIIVYDADGNVLRMSRTAADALGYSEADYGSNILTRVQQVHCEHPDGTPYAATEIPTVRALQGETVRDEVMLLRQPERTYWLSVSVAPIIAADGGLLGIVLTAADITALHAMQEQMQTFMHLVSHDLRIPLTIANGYVSYLKDCLNESESNAAQVSLDAIARAVKRMNVMIDDLVVVTRMEGGQLPLTRATFALPTWLPEFLERSSHALEVGRVQVELPASLPPLTADADRLERILTNLLSNALKYSDPDTPVQLRVHPREGACCFAVTDHGRGIDPEHLPCLFEKFYRADSSRKAEGIGLGLYITRLMVEAHGGHIWAESEPGAGSTFAFTIPYANS